MEAREMKYLYNWNAPIIWSQHEEDTYYHGAQYLLRTRDKGQNWEEISEDLTRNQDDKQGNGGGPYTNEAVGAENYGTLSYLIESPHEKGVLWTGSDDGLVHITKNGGETWTNVTPAGIPECLINAIDIYSRQHDINLMISDLDYLKQLIMVKLGLQLTMVYQMGLLQELCVKIQI